MRKLFLLLTLLIGYNVYGQLSTINTGTGPNTGSGDPIRTGFIKTNAAINLINALQLFRLNPAELAVLDGILASTTELNYLVGTNNPIQGQINAKLAISDTSSMLTGYVRRTTTVNSKPLSSNITITATDIGLGNVTNESKVTMFTNPTFTGTIVRQNTDTIATRSYARAVAGTGGTSLGAWGTISGSLSDQTDLQNALNAKAALASPTFTGTVKISTDTVATKAYTRSLIGDPMIYPGAGIPLSTGSAWGTSITNNSANWNTAYSWGNHASAGYATLTSPTFTGTVVLPSATSIGTVSSTEISYLDGLTSNLQIALNDTVDLETVFLAKYPSFNNQTGTSYTLVLADDAKIITMTNSSTNTVIIPLNSSVEFPLHAQITIFQFGSGQTIISPASGVTLNSAGGARKIRLQYSSITLLKTGIDTWVLVGDITI